jgi:hypothetical protein
MNVKSLMTSIFIIVLNIQFNKAQTCPNIESNIDYFGNDISFTIVTSVALCCTKCASQPGCTSFTFVNSNNICWLKNTTTANVKRLNTAGRIIEFSLLKYIFSILQ